MKYRQPKVITFAGGAPGTHKVLYPVETFVSTVIGTIFLVYQAGESVGPAEATPTPLDPVNGRLPGNLLPVGCWIQVNAGSLTLYHRQE